MTAVRLIEAEAAPKRFVRGLALPGAEQRFRRRQTAFDLVESAFQYMDSAGTRRCRSASSARARMPGSSARTRLTTSLLISFS